MTRVTPEREERATENQSHVNEFAELLHLLGIQPDERIAICRRRIGGSFTHEAARVRDDAAALAFSPSHEDCDVWFSVNPVSVPAGHRGRGGDSHVTRCVALLCDIDIKAGGVADSDTADLVVQEIAAVLGQMPAAVVATGHGGHPYWVLDAADDAWVLDTEEKRSAAAALCRRFHRLCAAVAARHGGCVDNVGQLSRILRVPGTSNYKDPADPLPVVLHTAPYGSYAPLSHASVRAALDARGWAETPEDRASTGEVLSDPDGWEFGVQTHGFVAAMVKGWQTDQVVGSRHNWLVAQATRLVAARRLGLLTEDDFADAAESLDDSFCRRLRGGGDRREPTPNEVRNAMAWATHRVATMTDAQAGEDLGVDPEGIRGFAADGAPSNVFYPPDFWESTDALRWIRNAALAQRVAPDAALLAVLAELSARIPPSVRVDTGIMQPLPLHLFGALVCRTGKGKTAAMKAARRIVDFKYPWPTDPFIIDSTSDRDDVPEGGKEQAAGGRSGTSRGVAAKLPFRPSAVKDSPPKGRGEVDTDEGIAAKAPVRYPVGEDFPRKGHVRTGEGIAEMFYGRVRKLNRETGKHISVRERVRTNVFMTSDEGAGLVKHILDDKSTVGETIRMAWSGTDFGQSNADAEKYRFVPDGEYTLAMLVVFHLDTVANLMCAEQLALGTPQRFLYAWARPNPKSVTRELVASMTNPGPLPVSVPEQGLRLCPELRVKVNAGHLKDWLSEDDALEDPVESQRAAMVARTAALLAVINGRSEVDETGRLVVPEEDWHLAETMFETSCSIVRMAVAERRAAAAQRKRTARYTELADAIEDDEARSTPQGRVKARFVGYLTELGPGEHKISGDGVLRRFNGEDLKLANAVIPELVGEGRISIRDGSRGTKYATLLN